MALCASVCTAQLPKVIERGSAEDMKFQAQQAQQAQRNGGVVKVEADKPSSPSSSGVEVAPMPKGVYYTPTEITPSGIKPGKRYTAVIPEPKPKPEPVQKSVVQKPTNVPVPLTAVPVGGTGATWVPGYRRKDGTYVKGYYRR